MVDAEGPVEGEFAVCLLDGPQTLPLHIVLRPAILCCPSDADALHDPPHRLPHVVAASCLFELSASKEVVVIGINMFAAEAHGCRLRGEMGDTEFGLEGGGKVHVV